MASHRKKSRRSAMKKHGRAAFARSPRCYDHWAGKLWRSTGEVRPARSTTLFDEVFTTQPFRDLYGALPTDVQSRARRAYQLFRRNPAHPGLNFKCVDDGS